MQQTASRCGASIQIKEPAKAVAIIGYIDAMLAAANAAVLRIIFQFVEKRMVENILHFRQIGFYDVFVDVVQIVSADARCYAFYMNQLLARRKSRLL